MDENVRTGSRGGTAMEGSASTEAGSAEDLQRALLSDGGARLPAALEAVLFALNRPISEKALAEWLQIPVAAVTAALERLREDLSSSVRGIQLVKEAGGYRLLSKPEWARVIERARQGASPRRELSRAALEVLAIVAYRQPVTRSEIDEIRGVRSEGVLARLIEDGLVEVAGRGEGLGRPLQFRTTTRFLELLGLEGLHQLPPLDADDEGKGMSQLPLHIPEPGGST